MVEPECLQTFHFNAPEMIQVFPPQWRHPNKLVAWEKAKNSGAPWEGKPTLRHWQALPIPKSLAGSMKVSVKQGAFAYKPPSEDTIAWHMNFADPVLFSAYDSSLFAQDEIQVLEHPILGSIREYLHQKQEPMRTLDRPRSRPTPVTITQVQRRVSVDTVTFPIYGNAFANVSESLVHQAVKPLVPATVSHILAMAALPGGHGSYTLEEIQLLFQTALTGFSAARIETERLVPQGVSVEIHTGFWGCGVFGGNRTLMAILQGLAAAAAGVSLVFWALNATGVQLAEAAFCDTKGLLDRYQADTEGLFHDLVGKGYTWSLGDGN